MLKKLAVCMFLSLGFALQAEETNFNSDFRFALGENPNASSEKFDDSAWECVGLPHSFSIPYFRSPHFYVGEGWYRKTFELKKAYPEEQFRLDFEGVFQFCDVYLNGQRVGGHQGGYTGFSVDLTPAVRDGENFLSVRVDNKWNARLPPRAGEHVFSGGIYRDVKLVRTPPVFIPRNGVRIWTSSVSKDTAMISYSVKITNATSRTQKVGRMATLILPDLPKGQTLASYGLTAPHHSYGVGTVEIQPGETLVCKDSIEVNKPFLWSPDAPNLYSFVCELFQPKDAAWQGKAPSDSAKISFGIRSFAFTADSGFILNGKPLFLRGANRHQDQAGWGDAISNAAHRRDAQMIKDCGMNFVRGSHYPHDPAFLKACDELGLIVWAENTYWGIGGFGKDGYWNCSAYPTEPGDEAPFIENNKRLLAELIDDQFNHPSVMVWSMCNEPFFVFNDQMEKSRELIRTLTDESHKLDPTRPVGVGGAQRQGFDKLGDIIGYNGDGARFPNPGRPNLVAEYGSHISDRPGVYGGTFGDVSGQPSWRAGQALWCAFHHGSIAGSMGRMGMIDFFRLPLRQWYWYRNEYAKIPPPQWPENGTPSALKFESNVKTFRADGTEDAFLTVTVLDANAKAVSNSPDVTLEIVEGPGEFPTGKSITFVHGSDIDIREGQCAIAFRAWHSGKIVLRATSPGLKSAEITLEATHAPAWKSEYASLWQRQRSYRAKPVSETARRESRDNLAFIRPTRASSQETQNSPDCANDGDRTTRWCAANGSIPAWWRVDLENFYIVDLIELELEKPGLYDYTVDVSEDGEKWTSVYVEKGYKKPVKRRHAVVNPIPGRFLRVMFTKVPHGVYPGIVDIKVGGKTVN